MSPKHIIISRTDKIGDVILTLPLAGALKKEFPQVKISFLGNSYTKAVILNAAHVDSFYDWDEIKNDAVAKMKKIGADAIVHVFPKRPIASAAKKAGIKIRIGTSHRVFHWWT
ncbi:MAG: glycosyl transferase family 9, partial [Bacteroidota bacterium]|nr:glycosyl transferase family 9 [Bacteroidota bacterium]